MKTAIIIPARYGSTRFPGKPLAHIAGRSMLSRVVAVGKKAAEAFDNISVFVATEDERIADHCKEIGAACIMTSNDCPTGSDRVLQAAENNGGDFDFIFSFQGDAPFTDPIVLTRMLEALKEQPDIQVITPVHRLDWDGLDRLREAKKTTPFSGTTVIRNVEFDKETNEYRETPYARFFSKQILPSIRNEKKLREKQAKDPKNETTCPVLQHIGVYGYRKSVLQKFVKLPQTPNEIYEGLEQLRLIDNNIPIFTAKVVFDDKKEKFLKLLQGGIDTPEDIARVERIIAEHGEPF